MRALIGKKVICKEPVILNGNAFLKMNGDYEVLDQNGDFILIHYLNLPKIGPVKGWWKSERFEVVEGM